MFDEKGNTVTITVVCCDPEKIRDKLCCKGAPAIKSITIKEPKHPEKPRPAPEPAPAPAPEKPKEPEKPKPPPAKPKEPEKPKPAPEKPKPKEPEKPKPAPDKPKVTFVDTPPQPKEKPAPPPPAMLPPPEKPKEAPNPPPPAPPVAEYPPPFPVRTCCGECYHGFGGGPCYMGYGGPPPACYDGWYYDYGRGCYVSKCDYYLSEENPRSCSIM